MADAFFQNFKRDLAAEVHDLLNDDIKVIAVDLADYTFDATHDDIADVPAGAQVGEASLTGKTLSVGQTSVFDSDNPVLPSVTGDPFEALILYNETADKLIGFFDGISQTPSGNNIDVNVNGSGWFSW